MKSYLFNPLRPQALIAPGRNMKGRITKGQVLRTDDEAYVQTIRDQFEGDHDRPSLILMNDKGELEGGSLGSAAVSQLDPDEAIRARLASRLIALQSADFKRLGGIMGIKGTIEGIRSTIAKAVGSNPGAVEHALDKMDADKVAESAAAREEDSTPERKAPTRGSKKSG